MGIVKIFDGTIGSIFNKKVKVEGVEVYEYLGKCEIKIRVKNIDISKIVNERILPKTQGNLLFMNY